MITENTQTNIVSILY